MVSIYCEQSTMSTKQTLLKMSLGCIQGILIIKELIIWLFWVSTYFVFQIQNSSQL